jgi:transcriptional regulator with XRE-family HTH domain
VSLDSIKEFYHELAKILSTHEEGFSQISEDTGVSRSTLWRWSNETNRSYPDADKLLRVLSKISGLDREKDICKYFGGKIEEYILNVCPITSGKNAKVFKYDSPAEAITDFYSFIVFSICGTKRGATEEELVNVIGNLAIKRSGFPKADITQDLINAHGAIAKTKIKDLVQKEIISRNNFGRFHRTTKDITLDLKTSLTYLPSVISEMLKPEEFNKGYNAIFGYTESIPLSLANELAIETKQFFKSCYEKMEANKTKDGVPFTIINFAERLWFDSLDGSLEGEVK